MAILHLPEIILYIYTNIIKICHNGNTVREFSNWIQLELFQLPPMHDLCMQAQQKLHMHQMLYTGLAWELQTREAWIHLNQTSDGNTPVSSQSDF